MWSVSVIFKTTLIKHRHDKEKFDADHFYGGYHHHHHHYQYHYHYHYHHHHYHHHHHHHKHHYRYKVQKPLLSICLSSELSLSILFSSNFICNHFCHHSPFFCCCFVWYLFYFIIIILGREAVVGVAHKFGIFVRTVLRPLAPLSGD